jgi:predicted GIY-YIG superfamily endonuclease
MSFVYMLRCVDGSLYVGHTNDLASREQTHNDGLGARYTATRRPVRMVYAEEYASIREAITRERQLKRWTTEKKEALVVGNLSILKVLSQRPNRARTRVTFTWQDLMATSNVKRGQN